MLRCDDIQRELVCMRERDFVIIGPDKYQQYKYRQLCFADHRPIRPGGLPGEGVGLGLEAKTSLDTRRTTDSCAFRWFFGRVGLSVRRLRLQVRASLHSSIIMQPTLSVVRPNVLGVVSSSAKTRGLSISRLVLRASCLHPSRRKGCRHQHLVPFSRT